MSAPSSPESDDLRRRTVSSFSWAALDTWVSRLVSLAVFVLLGRLLSPDAFGLVALASTSLALLTVFVGAGFAQALVQLPNITQRDRSTAFWTSLGLALSVYTALFFAAPLLASGFDTPELAPILRVCGITVIASALASVPSALHQRSFNFRTLASLNVLSSVAAGIAAITLAVLGAGAWALVAQAVLSACVGAVLIWFTTPWRPGWEYSFRSLRKLWKIGASVLGIGLIEALQSNVDKLVIGAAFTTEALGYYSVAQRVGMILIEVVTAIMTRVSLSTFSRVQDDLPRLNRILRQLTFLASSAGVGIFGIIATLGPQVITGVFGAQWEMSVLYLWILAPGWALATTMIFDQNALIAAGKPARALLISTTTSAVSIGMVFVLLPFGVVGVAISRMARLVVWPLRLAVLKRTIELPVARYLGQVVRTVVAFIPIGVGIIALQSTPWARADHSLWIFALPVGVMGTIAYALLVWLLATRESRNVLRQVTHDVFGKVLHGSRK